MQPHKKNVLAEDRLRNRTHLVGSFRNNRKGNPTGVIEKTLQNEIICMGKDARILSKNRVKRDILVICTCHKLELTHLEMKLLLH